MTRQLTPEQRQYAEQAYPIIEVVIRSFLRDNQQRRELARRCDLHGAAQEAVCLAALTYDPEKAGISAYFSIAIHRAIVKEIVKRERNDRRTLMVWKVSAPQRRHVSERLKGRALKALQLLNPYEKKLLEDHLIEGVTVTRLAREQDLNWQTVKRRITKAIESLREAERHLP